MTRRFFLYHHHRRDPTNDPSPIVFPPPPPIPARVLRRLSLCRRRPPDSLVDKVTSPPQPRGTGENNTRKYRAPRSARRFWRWSGWGEFQTKTIPHGRVFYGSRPRAPTAVDPATNSGLRANRVRNRAVEHGSCDSEYGRCTRRVRSDARRTKKNDIPISSQVGYTGELLWVHECSRQIAMPYSRRTSAIRSIPSEGKQSRIEIRATRASELTYASATKCFLIK